MRTHRTPLVRAALAVHRQLERRQCTLALSDLPTAAFERCRRQLALLSLAEGRSWPAAARACRDRFRWSLVELRRQVDASLQELVALPAGVRGSVRDVYDDLVALGAEFEEVAIDLKERLLTVTTEPIDLEGVSLGRFSVVLEWERLREGSGCYEVVALDPQPAAADSAVTHPHVRDGNLCEGEGSGAIRAALGSGRLLDFFTVVARMLANYNPGSAFVSLDHWEGVSCADCGCNTYDDDRTACEACDCDLCCDCAAGCHECSRSLCGECSRSCRQCREIYCAGCLAECTACQEDFCGGCLNDRTCKTCGDQEAVREAEADSPPCPAPDVAVLAVRLGQAAVPA